MTDRKYPRACALDRAAVPNGRGGKIGVESRGDHPHQRPRGFDNFDHAPAPADQAFHFELIQGCVEPGNVGAIVSHQLLDNGRAAAVLLAELVAPDRRQ